MGAPMGVGWTRVTEPFSSEDTGLALWDEAAGQTGKQEMGWGAGEEGGQLLCPSGRGAVDHPCSRWARVPGGRVTQP